MSLILVHCAQCGCEFSARKADRNRGWARYCLKRCKAVKQERRTHQYAALLNTAGYTPIGEDDINPPGFQ